MSAWLDNFQMMGVKLNEGEKSLMRFAINKERERIIKLLEEIKMETLTPEEAIAKGWKWNEIDQMWWLPQNSLIALIKGETNE